MNRFLKKLLSLTVAFMMVFSLVATKSALANTGYTLEGWHKANSLWTTGAIKGYMELDWVDLKFGVNSYDGIPTEFTVELDYNNGGIIGYEHAGYFVLYEGLDDFTPDSEPAEIVGGYSITTPVVAGDILTFTLKIEDIAKFVAIEEFTLKFKAQLSDNAAEWPGASLQYRLLGADKTVSMMRNDIIYLGDLTINKILLDANGDPLGEARDFDIVVTSDNGTPPIYRTVTSGSHIVIENLEPGTYTVTEPGYGDMYEVIISNDGVVVFTGDFPDASITITNKIKVPLIDVTATKVWVGGPSPRPTVSFQLYRNISGGEMMPVGDPKDLPDGITEVTWEDMPKTDPVGNMYTYTVKEIGVPENYEKVESGLTVTNTYESPLIDVEGMKTWVGGPVPRPDISLQLYRHIEGGEMMMVGDPVVLHDGETSYLWEDMPKTDGDGKIYIYTVDEVAVPENYVKSLDGLEVTNTYEPPLTDIMATKTWIGGPEEKPDIMLQLYRSIPEGEPMKVGPEVKLEGGWTGYTWLDMPTTDMDGHPYTYTVKEIGVPENYEKAEEGMEITNEYVSPKTYVTLQKIWVGGPEVKPSIQVQLYRKISGGEVMPVGDPVTIPNGTVEYTWNNLDVTDFNGNPYTYSVDEVAVPGYDKLVVGYTVTNTRIKGDIEFYKHDELNMPLAGAIFGLYSKADTLFAAPIMTSTSLTDGLVWFKDVDFGEYNIKEISAPAGYEKSNVVIPVAITEQGKTVIPTPSIVKNIKIMGDITIKKVDSVTKAVLAGAKVIIKDKAGTVVFEGTSGADGLVKAVLPVGEYIISEILAPEGYVLTTQTYAINIDRTGLVFNVEIPNTEEEELPQTGGIPSELLYALGAMAVIGGILLMRRKRT